VAPTYVKTTEGKSEGIGSVVKVHYADGTIWEIRVTEVSVSLTHYWSRVCWYTYG
jgi:hypothetical protein